MFFLPPRHISLVVYVMEPESVLKPSAYDSVYPFYCHTSPPQLFFVSFFFIIANLSLNLRFTG